MEIFVLKSDEVAAITRGTHGNPHHILGMHQCLNDCYVNAYLPRATAAFVLRINESGKAHLIHLTDIIILIRTMRCIC
jgi:hypothetical protein